MQGHDIVSHLGANTDIPRGYTDTRMDLENCTIATFNVLEAVRVNNVGKLLFASSAAVYGEAPVYPTREDMGPIHGEREVAGDGSMYPGFSSTM